jgi:uncharacterized protein (TIRG00374 family)
VRVKHAGRVINFLIGFGLAALLLWFFLSDADWAALGAAIGRAHGGFLALAFAGHFLSLVIRSQRWRILLSPIKRDIHYAPVWKYFNIGFAVTSLLPGRIGEVLRPYLLARDQGISFASSFATVVTERVIDLVAVLALLGTIFLFPDALGPQAGDPQAALLIGTIKAFGLAALAVALAAIVFLALLRMKTEWALAIVRFLSKPLPKKASELAERLVRSFAAGIGGLRGLRDIGMVLVITVANWLLVAGCFWLALGGFGMWVPYHHVFFLLAVVALGVVVPTPAGTGTFHVAVAIVAFNLWGLPESSVKAYAIVNHLITFSPVVIIGVFYLLSGRINVLAAADRAAEESSAGGEGSDTTSASVTGEE